MSRDTGKNQKTCHQGSANIWGLRAFAYGFKFESYFAIITLPEDGRPMTYICEIATTPTTIIAEDFEILRDIMNTWKSDHNQVVFVKNRRFIISHYS